MTEVEEYRLPVPWCSAEGGTPSDRYFAARLAAQRQFEQTGEYRFICPLCGARQLSPDRCCYDKQRRA